MEREYFSQGEALAKVGHKIRTLIEFSGVPKGTTGIVLEPNDRLVSLPIQWDLPERPYGAYSKPLVDWFSKDEYEKFLEET